MIDPLVKSEMFETSATIQKISRDYENNPRPVGLVSPETMKTAAGSR
jgi:hypothetical protein